MPIEAAFLLCQTDGRLVASNHVWRRWFAAAADCARLEEVSARLNCPALVEAVWRFAEPTELVTTLTIGAQPYQLRLHRLGEGLLLEFIPVVVPADSEAALLVQIGRLTSRLIHDFKNQMGGLKLYASYLKKRLAAAELGAAGKESAEIADKIIESLNTMAETATLVSRLTRPVELRRETGKLAELIEQVLHDQQPYATARQVELRFAGKPDAAGCEFSFDPLQLRGALNALLRRAIEVSPAAGTVVGGLQQTATACVLTVTDQGLALTAAQRLALFDFVTNERLNKAALELGFAKHVIEAHGGSLTATAAGATGTQVSVSFPIS